MYYNFLPQLYGFILTLRQLALILSQRRYHKLRKKKSAGKSLFSLLHMFYKNFLFALCTVFIFIRNMIIWWRDDYNYCTSLEFSVFCSTMSYVHTCTQRHTHIKYIYLISVIQQVGAMVGREKCIVGYNLWPVRIDVQGQVILNQICK